MTRRTSAGPRRLAARAPVAALLALGSILPLASCGDPNDPLREDHPALVRVRVGLLDDRAGRLVVWDPKAEGVAGVLELGAGTRLRAVASTGAYAAVQRDGEGLVRFVYGGVAAVSHGDHVDLLKGKPELLATAAEVSPDATVLPALGAFGLSPRAGDRAPGVLLERLLRLEPKVETVEGLPKAEPTLLPLGEHGALVASGGALFVVAKDGARGAQLADCAGPVRVHAGGGRVAVACGASVHLVDVDPATGAATLARTVTLAAEPTTLERHHATGSVLARTGPKELSVVDGASFEVRRVGFGFEPCQATFEVLGGAQLVVLGSDGDVRTVGVDGANMRTASVTQAFACGGDDAPSFAHVPEHAYVGVPGDRVLADVDLVEARVLARVEVDVVPRHVVAFGLDVTNAGRSVGKD